MVEEKKEKVLLAPDVYTLDVSKIKKVKDVATILGAFEYRFIDAPNLDSIRHLLAKLSEEEKREFWETQEMMQRGN